LSINFHSNIEKLPVVAAVDLKLSWGYAKSNEITFFFASFG